MICLFPDLLSSEDVVVFTNKPGWVRLGVEAPLFLIAPLMDRHCALRVSAMASETSKEGTSYWCVCELVLK